MVANVGTEMSRATSIGLSWNGYEELDSKQLVYRSRPNRPAFTDNPKDVKIRTT
jgi:hypothetical protein